MTHATPLSASSSPNPSSQRSHLTSSPLVRFLSDLDLASAGEAKQSFAERLAQWLGVSDAITLFAALNAKAAAGQAAPGMLASGLVEEVARVRGGLVAAIQGEVAGKVRLKWPAPPAGATLDHLADFLPYQRYYGAHQREMEAALGPLRGTARAALAAHSPQLRQLATLDAVLDKALAERERSLLATVPARLERRYERLRRTQLAAAAAGSAAAGVSEAVAGAATEGTVGLVADTVAGAVTETAAETASAEAAAPAMAENEAWTQPGGWLAVFAQDTRSLLLAELEVRLQPVLGLMEALSNEVTKQQ